MNMIWLRQGRRYRCPICRVIYYSARAVCHGGEPYYDPAQPGAVLDDHEPTPVAPDLQTGWWEEVIP